MTTPPVTSITDELIAELGLSMRMEWGYGYPDKSKCDLYDALLAERADLKQQLVAAGITADNCEMFRKDAERWRYARDLMHPDDIRDFQDARVSFGMRPTENISAQCDAAIDAAMRQ